jgi:antirestriction protein
MTTNDTPRVYIACLACYNEGKLHGEWIDATDADEMQALIAALQADPRLCAVCDELPAAHRGPELFCELEKPGQKYTRGTGCGHIDNDWAIHDYDGLPSDLGENPDLAKVAELAQAIEEHGEPFRAYLENLGAEYATVESFEESYQGQYDSEKDYAYGHIDSTGILGDSSEFVARYFDYDAFARDLFMDGYSFVRYNGTGYVFSDE